MGGLVLAAWAVATPVGCGHGAPPAQKVVASTGADTERHTPQSTLSPAQGPQSSAAPLLIAPSPTSRPVSGSDLQVSHNLEADVSIASLDGGQVRLENRPDGITAFTFPDFEESPTPPRAAILLTPTGDEDPLSPGVADFAFGADFRRNEQSAGTVVDNGDNLIQRGLFSQASQYKIDLDGGRPQCRVQGSTGAVEVRMDVLIEPDRWYQIRCVRSGDAMTLVLSELLPDGSTSHLEANATGPIGDVSWLTDAPPLSIGGKAAPNGSLIRSGTDQFNGSIANPMFELMALRD